MDIYKCKWHALITTPHIHLNKYLYGRWFFLFIRVCSFFLQKRRERGRISIKGVRLVEPATLNSDGGDSSAPEVCGHRFFNIIFLQLCCLFLGLLISNRLLWDGRSFAGQVIATVHFVFGGGQREGTIWMDSCHSGW